MIDNCKTCPWLCPVEHECLLGYFDCLKELEQEYKEEIEQEYKEEIEQEYKEEIEQEYKEEIKEDSYEP